MSKIIATEVTLEIEATVETPLAVTALTKADPGVATSAGHGLSNGDVVKFAVTDGMVELNEQVVRIANVATDTFELEDLDTTNYSTWNAGTAAEVSAWSTLCQATSINIGNASPTELDGSDFCSKKQETLYGLPGSTSGTIDLLHDAQLASVQYLKSKSTADLVGMRVTWSNGYVTIFGAKTAYSGGFNAALNQIVTGAIPVTVPNEIMEYPS